MRDTMRAYDTDEAVQSEALEELIAEGDLVKKARLQTFAPDTVEEARNRGFRPI